MNKPDSVREIEERLGIRLHPLKIGEITDYQNRKCYELNASGALIGLNLSSCYILNGSFLQSQGQLTSLNLSGNVITDGSFLKTLRKLTSLDLSGNVITDGSFLQSLPHLKSLSISNEKKLASYLKSLSQLTKLEFGGRESTDVSFLQSMPRLTSLRLGDTDIKDWSFLNFLDRLTNIELSYIGNIDWSIFKNLNQLTSLSFNLINAKDWSFLQSLPRLTSLCLSSTNIIDWSFLQSLPRLTSLYVFSTSIIEWSVLKSLTQLTSLDLYSSGINDLSFLQSMSQLSSLNLSGTGINDLSFLQSMSQLSSLNLSGNVINDLSFLNSLGQLTSLILRENKVFDLTFLNSMPQLTTIDLGDNQLKQIPVALLERGLDLEWSESWGYPQSINIAGNPIETPPLEIAKRGDRAIRSWFAERKAGARALNEVKVIFVGDGEAGKTTLRKRLMGLKPDPKESQTHGIEIHQHSVHCGGVDIRVHFWDFGGQEILHATHQFFLSRRSLYILVLDGRKEEDVESWLKHIRSFGGDSPILICMNKMDQNPSFEVNRSDLQNKYGIREFYRLKCLVENDEGIRQLRRDLPAFLTEMELARSEWPVRWFKVKEQLEKDDRPYVGASRF